LGHPVDREAMKVLQEGSGDSLELWITPDYRNELVKKMAAMAVIRKNADVVPCGSDILSLPDVKYTTDQKYTSGVRLSWFAENPGSNPTEATNPVGGRLIIPVHTATADIFVTRQMLEDSSMDILGYINNLGAEAFALGEEDVFINGNGSGKPQGILSHPMAIVANGSGDGMYIATGSTAGIAWGSTTSGVSAGATTGILGLEQALPPQYEAGAKWYGNKKSYSAVRANTDSQGRPLWMATDGYANWSHGLPPTLLGYELEKTQFLPDPANAAYPMLFGDMKAYLIADRVGLSVEVYREPYAQQELVLVHMRKRVGGQVVRPWMLKTLKQAAS
jgi:HK97 family phage major capsid protein